MTAAPATAPGRLAGPDTLEVVGRLTIHTVTEVHAHVVTALGHLSSPDEGSPDDARTPSLDLDLREVSEIDTAGLQLLLWTAREARSQGITLRTTLSPAVGDVVARAGLHPGDLAHEEAR